MVRYSTLWGTNPRRWDLVDRDVAALREGAGGTHERWDLTDWDVSVPRWAEIEVRSHGRTDGMLQFFVREEPPRRVLFHLFWFVVFRQAAKDGNRDTCNDHNRCLSNKPDMMYKRMGILQYLDTSYQGADKMCIPMGLMLGSVGVINTGLHCPKRQTCWTLYLHPVYITCTYVAIIWILTFVLCQQSHQKSNRYLMFLERKFGAFLFCTLIVTFYRHYEQNMLFM